MEKNLRDKVEMEIHHHISPLIGWLRSDAAKGFVDTDGTRYEQWKDRANRAVDAIMEHVGEVEYEYAVVFDAWLETGWRPEDEDDWTTLGEATEQLNHFKTSFPKDEYRIVKRRMAGGIEEL